MPILKHGDKLGQILIKTGLITPEQLAKALEVQKGTTKRIGEVLVEIGLLTEKDIAAALSKQLGIPYASAACLSRSRSSDSSRSAGTGAPLPSVSS